MSLNTVGILDKCLKSCDKRTSTRVIAAVAIRSLSVADPRPWSRLDSQHGLLRVHTGRGRLADVGGGGAGRQRGAGTARSSSGGVSIEAGGLTTPSCGAALLLLMLLIEPFQFFGTSRSSFLLHAPFLFLTAAAGSFNCSRDLSGGLLSALAPGLVLIFPLRPVDQKTRLWRVWASC